MTTPNDTFIPSSGNVFRDLELDNPDKELAEADRRIDATPESILARFAAAYAEHGPAPARRLRITLSDNTQIEGYVERPNDGVFDLTDGDLGWALLPTLLDRIDYANARYRGAAPLWQREG